MKKTVLAEVPTGVPIGLYRRADVSVPQALNDELAATPKGKALSTGIDIAGRAIRQIKEENLCDGIHIMAVGKEVLVRDIMSAAGLI